MVTKAQVLDRALALAHTGGWERLTLNQLARSLAVPLADIQQHFNQKDDLVEAWFDRADQTLLSQAPNPDWSNRPPAERIERVIQCWLDALAQHRTLTGQMLLYKLEPGHFHLQAAGVLRISRTVQWFREAAELNASHGRRIAQELALSSLYLAVFLYWLRDSSAGQRKTRALLRRKLTAGDRLGLWF